MSFIRVSHLIGKPSLSGGWIIPRPPGSRHKQALEEIERTSRMARVRIRPGFKEAALGNEIRGLASDIQCELAAKGSITAVMNWGNFSAQNKCYYPETRVFKDGEIYEVSGRDALHLLGSKPHMWAFEEYLDDSELKPLIPETKASAASVNELQEQVRYLTDSLRALQAQQNAAPAKKKRTIKEMQSEADAEDGEG